VSDTDGSKGLATALSEGETTITAAVDNAVDTADLDVIEAQLATVQVTPVDPVLPLPPPLYPTEVQFEATAVYTDGSEYGVTAESAWASSDEDVALISNERYEEGLLTILATGETIVSAVFNEMEGTSTLTVTDPVLTAIYIDPSDPVLAQGETLQLTAMGAWSNFEQADVTNDAVWESDNESVATVEPGGMLTAGSTAGTALITATLDGVVGFATVTVTESSP